MADLQDYYMKNESCFHVDSNDNILSFLSKYDSHRLDPSTSLAPLHRAFSVFLLSPDASQLLIQQRSEHKITFPLLWANTCCSHPIAGLGEDTEDVITGVVKAARRKLHHELGIPVELMERKTFYHCGRIHYHANQGPWGEHESTRSTAFDHILLVFSDEEIVNSLNINTSEVKAIEFVDISQLHSSSSSLTPWLQKILSTDLLSSWITAVRDLKENNDMIPLKTTKYSHDPIIKL